MKIPTEWFIAPDAAGVPTILKWGRFTFETVTDMRSVGDKMAWAILTENIPVALLDERLEVVLDDDGNPVMVTK